MPRQATPVEMEVRDEMQKVALESPAYGYRRITAELQQRGFEVNHKRVLRMMRERNLPCVSRRAFVVTTDSRHNLAVYPNLAREMKPLAINQLWVADITYIRLLVYLAVVLDVFSRQLVRGTNPKLANFFLDAGHGYLGGDDPAEIMRRHAERIVGCHLKTFNGPSSASQVPLGEGDYIRRVFSA